MNVYINEERIRNYLRTLRSRSSTRVNEGEKSKRSIDARRRGGGGSVTNDQPAKRTSIIDSPLILLRSIDCTLRTKQFTVERIGPESASRLTL